MPRAPKPKELRQNRERRDLGDVETPDEQAAADLVVPRPPVGLLPAVRRSWDRFWRSPARAAVVESLDLDLIERLYTLYDERERARQALRRPQVDPESKKPIRGTDSRVVEGSTGQLRPNQFYTIIGKLDSSIMQLEDRVAKSMKARLILGMIVKDGRPDDAGDDERPDRPAGTRDADDDGPSEDPRLHLVVGGTR